MLQNYDKRGGHFPETAVIVVYQLCGRMRDDGSRPLPQGGRTKLGRAERKVLAAAQRIEDVVR